MRAVVTATYGPPEVARIQDLPLPEPRSGQVLAKVSAVAVTSADARIRGARFPRGFGAFGRLAFGVRRPRRTVLGSAFCGVVERSDDPGFEIGARVCGMTGLRMGAHAEYVAAPTKSLVHVPEQVSDEDAAGVLFGGTTALHFLDHVARLRAGQTVLVNGASGAIGTNAVQLARHHGATVTAVTSGRNAALVRELGATHVHDHTRSPVDDLSDITERFDVVLDTVGNLSPAQGKRLLRPGGVVLLAVADLPSMLRAHGQVKAGPAPERPGYFTTLLDLVASGELRVVTERVFGLDEAVEAHRLVDSGHKVGNVLLRP